MIAGTNTNCKVLNISVVDSTATITLLFFATKATVPSKALKIYIQDKGSRTYTLATQNTYWVDFNSDYSSNATNININKHKEIKITIDITNNNTGMIIENRWLRECFIHIMDAEDVTLTPLWSTGCLQLVSNQFELPIIKRFLLRSTKENNSDTSYIISADITIDYKSQLDFNYNNTNFYYEFKIFTLGKVLLEKIVQTTNSLETDIKVKSVNKYSEPVYVELKIYNKNNILIVEYSKEFNPEYIDLGMVLNGKQKVKTSTYIKTANGIRRVLGLYIRG